MKRFIAFLLAGLVAACGGGGGDGNPGPSTPPDDGFLGRLPGGESKLVEEKEATFSGTWTDGSASLGWSGGTAKSSSEAGAKATFAFNGTAIRWIGARGKNMGKARVSIDGGPAREVDLAIIPADEIRTNALTVYGLSDGAHTLTIEVVSGTVVVDGFVINPKTTVSHWQETHPTATYSTGWMQASNTIPWSGSGVSTPPDAPLTAQETYGAGETVTVQFRGSAISWIGYKGPDGGIATVQLDGGTAVEVDTYSPTVKIQEVLYTAAASTDGSHTLTITATGNKNAASSAARIVVDAFDVMASGIRAEENNPAIAYSGFWDRNIARVFSEGAAARAHDAGASVTFTFTGTSVSWIGARKSNGGGSARVYLDGVFQQIVTLRETYPTEAYQVSNFRIDGLPAGRHTLKIEAVGDGHVYVDGFDVQ